MRRAYLLLLPMLLGAGCSFLKPSVDPTTYYVLTATATTAAPNPQPRVVGVEPVHLPEYLDRPQLVTRIGPNQLRISDIERWAEPLGDALTSTLRQDVAAALPDAMVVVQPDVSQHVDAQIVVEVMRFERVADNAVELAVRWKLRDGSGNVQLAKDARIRQATTDAKAPAAVAALSQALATLAAELAAAIGRQ